jgi:F-type H+-transporting ATPase subunit delta
MSQNSITQRYAKALFDLAQENNALQPVYVSLQEINGLLITQEDFKAFIHNPLLSVEERAKVLQGVFKDKIPAILYKFIQFLNFKNRLNYLGDIFESFDQLFLEKNNQMRVSLQTAFELKDDQKKGIQKKLTEKYHKEIALETEVKQELLGGFRLLVQGTLFDGTIKTQLEQFKQKVLI